MDTNNLIAMVMIFTVVVAIAATPGIIADRRNHKNAMAVKVTGYCSLICPPVWIVAIVWAFVK